MMTRGLFVSRRRFRTRFGGTSGKRVPLDGWAGAAAAMLFLAGCGSQPGRSSGGSTSAAGESEPNDTFVQAHKPIFDNGATARLTGSIDHRDDLDVFDLGAAAVGQRIVVDVGGTDQGLDASVALFDENFKLVMDNDDEDLQAALLDPFFEHVIRHGGDSCFLVVGRSAFAGFSPESGAYEVRIRIEPGADVPAPKSQTLYLNFDGGEVEPDNMLVKEVRPFEAALIDQVYSGQDQVIKQVIVETMLENYEGFDVVIITDLDQLPAEGRYSTVMFGSRSLRAFGISESVDHYNGDAGDLAIVFTESFDPQQFESTPSAEELGVAIGNIAAHEAGHLLGLNHVDDPTALMDAVSPADTFLEDQDFKTSPLSQDIMPIGYQDAPLLLSETVGLIEGYTITRPLSLLPAPGPRLRRPDARSWCATCNRKLGR